MPPRFSVLWLTVLAFGIVAAATKNEIIGPAIFVFILPAVLLAQWPMPPIDGSDTANGI